MVSQKEVDYTLLHDVLLSDTYVDDRSVFERHRRWRCLIVTLSSLMP